MAWIDQLGRVTIGGRQLIGASFRGVPFFVESSERAGGRRTVTKELPFRDEPHVEDLGRAARTFPMEGYVLGDDYLAQRDALISALEDSAGPGLLVHPTYGQRQVICTGFRVRESKREGGLATFGLEFAETEELPRTPTAAPDAASLLDTSATAAATAVGDDFLASYDDDGQPPWAMAAISGLLAGAAAQMEELLLPVVTSTEALSELRGQMDVIADTATQLVRAPADAVSELAEVFVALVSDVLEPRAGLAALLDFAAAEPPEPRPEGTTTTRARQQANFDALLALMRRGALVQAGRLAPLETYDSYQDAVETRELIADALDVEMQSAGDDAFPALQQLRADLVRSVPGEDSSLARLVQFTPPASVPSLVLAYRLYGALDLESDLLARNHVEHPVFVLGGRELEVLSSG